MFQTLGTPLVAGRDFTWTDLYDTRDVAIISENLARELWGSPAAALGKRIREYLRRTAPWREIVGVAGDVHDDGVHQRPPATIYWPATTARAAVRHSPDSSRAGSASPSAPNAPARRACSTRCAKRCGRSHADLPLAQVRTLDEVYDQSMARTSFTLVMLAIAGAMALLLGVFGIYGVISYAVSQRRREIGIRLALGAQAREIRRLFVRRGLVLVGIGVAIGLGGAAGFTRLMQSLLFGISPLDPITFTAMPVVLAAAAVLASYLPARRAVAVDPVETLRAE